MTNLYSVAICVPDPVKSQVRNLKDLLGNRVGNYPSRNSEAHITFNVFEFEAGEMAKLITFLLRFAEKASSSTLKFVNYGTYSNGAFYLAPDAETKSYLLKMMKFFKSVFPFVSKYSNDPHITIARGLNGRNLALAKEVLSSEVNVEFLCSYICLRQFDPVKKQYFVVGYYDFKNKSNFEDNQLSFFDV